jgi:hypothetical protein
MDDGADYSFGRSLASNAALTEQFSRGQPGFGF